MSTNIETTTEKNKFKIKVSHVVEKEIEVDFPYYAQYGRGAFYKVISQGKSLIVQNWSLQGVSIEINENGYFHPEATPITEKEFEDAFFTAFQEIGSIGNEIVNSYAGEVEL